MKLLFICTAHFNRSVTAEQIFAHSTKYHAKSAGLGFLCSVQVDEKLVTWADRIFVMNETEESQKSFLVEKFKHIPGIQDKIEVLDIADTYIRNSPELIALLKKRLKKFGIVPETRTARVRKSV